MSEQERKTIWGTFPLPDGEEILQAWNQVARRTNNTARMEGREPRTTDLGDRTREIVSQCPELVPFLNKRAGHLSQATGKPEVGFGYMRGAAELLELLGTIAMNRQFEEVVPEIDTPESPE